MGRQRLLWLDRRPHRFASHRPDTTRKAAVGRLIILSALRGIVECGRCYVDKSHFCGLCILATPFYAPFVKLS
jgi:hypothetical protein